MDRAWLTHSKKYEDLPNNLLVLFGEVNGWLKANVREGWKLNAFSFHRFTGQVKFGWVAAGRASKCRKVETPRLTSTFISLD